MADRSVASLPPLARALKAWRTREGLSQRAAAARFSVPLTSWTDMEQRATSPSTHPANVSGAIILELMGEA